MAFLEAAKAASLPALVAYVLVVLFAHIVWRRNFNHLAVLGVVCGLVVGNGLVAQFEFVDPLLEFASMAGSMGVFLFLFNLVAKRLPLKSAS